MSKIPSIYIKRIYYVSYIEGSKKEEIKDNLIYQLNFKKLSIENFKANDIVGPKFFHLFLYF